MTILLVTPIFMIKLFFITSGEHVIYNFCSKTDWSRVEIELDLTNFSSILVLVVFFLNYFVSMTDIGVLAFVYLPAHYIFACNVFAKLWYYSANIFTISQIS